MSHTIGQVKPDKQESNSNSNRSAENASGSELTSLAPSSGLSDTDYEFLFNQLLEGIAHGWQDHRIRKFFQQLGDRGQQADWITWLERLRDKLVKLPIESKRSLGTMMIRFGELTKAAPEVSQIGAASYRLGQELLFGNTPVEIWEYAGADLDSETRQVETEQELSARLPDDFSALGVAEVNEVNQTEIGVNSGSKPIDSLPEVNLDLDLDLELDQQPENFEQVASSQGVSSSEAEISWEAEPQVLVAEKLDQQPDLESASLALEQQQELATNTVQIQELEQSSLELIESWFNLGLKQVSAGEYSEAIASWDKALKINPNLPEAWHNRGSALGRLGDYEAAVKSFQSALALDPDNYQAWNDRAHALYQLENWSGSIESWSQAIKIMPGNHLFWYNRGCAFEQLAKWQDAIASYEKALEIKPDFQPGRSRYINLVADNSLTN